MKLKSLRLRNISCFEDIKLDFCHEKTGEPCKWVVLLGENGTGKSTICQMIINTLLHSRLSNSGYNIDYAAFIRNDDLQNSIMEKSFQDSLVAIKSQEHPHNSPSNITIKCQKDNVDNPSFESKVTSYFGIGLPLVADIEGFVDRNIKAVNSDQDDPIYSQTDGWYIGAYGANRNTETVPSQKNFPEVNDKISNRFSSLFVGSHISNAANWISELFFQKIHPNHSSEDEDVFNRAISALDSVLPYANFKEVTKNGIVLMEDSGNPVSINRLSDGYKSTLTWVLDLTKHLCEAFPQDKFPDLKSPLYAPGVVLVDEIDLHLHPKWQRKVVEMIGETFPNIQFIVTTHSPFVAQDMSEDNKLIVLKRGENGAVRAEHGMGFAKRWRADQILTSWLFDLETTRDGDADTDEKDYQFLLRKEVSEKLTDKEKAQLRNLKQKLDKDPLGETLSDQEIYAAADALANALLADANDRH